MSGLNEFLMREVEMPLIPVVADLEDAGYPIDRAHFDDLRTRLEPEAEAASGRIREAAGDDFNPRSSPQLRAFLHGTLGLEVLRRTEAGEPATDKATLGRAAADHPIAGVILRHRVLSRILSTYATIPERVDEDGRFRVPYNQLDAATGRFTSPSLIQTIPRGDEFGIRGGFVAGEGCLIVGADFKQQELRILAHCSGDEALKAAIRAGVDLHGLAAVKVFGLDCYANEVEVKHKARRDQVKAIQFGLIYGRSARSLAAELAITEEEAERLIGDYFERFPAVKGFIDGVHGRLARDGFVDDVFGRRRYFPVARIKAPGKSWSRMDDQERALTREIRGARRAAQNFVIQGAAATITKLAMIRCHRHVAAEHPDARMILTLHDELHFEAPRDLVDHLARELPGLMCDLGLGRFGFDVPMAVEVKAGPSWGELKAYKGASDGGNHADGAAG